MLLDEITYTEEYFKLQAPQNAQKELQDVFKDQIAIAHWGFFLSVCPLTLTLTKTQMNDALYKKGSSVVCQVFPIWK